MVIFNSCQPSYYSFRIKDSYSPLDMRGACNQDGKREKKGKPPVCGGLVHTVRWDCPGLGHFTPLKGRHHSLLVGGDKNCLEQV